MKLLLDTHVWLWSLLDQKKLGTKASRLIQATTNELWLSPVSVWEAAILVERKRLRVRGTFQSWLGTALQKLPVTEAPLTNAVALGARQVQVEHDDPADRFIAATAEVFGLTLMTADERLLASRGFKHIACR